MKVDMKIDTNTQDKTIYIFASETTGDIATVDQWIKALRVARKWLRKELEQKK
jgi:hypothetical protein